MSSYWSQEIFSQNFFVNPLYYLTSSQIRLIPLIDDCQSTYLTDYYYFFEKEKKKNPIPDCSFSHCYMLQYPCFCNTNFPSSHPPPKYTLQTEHRHHGSHLYSILLHLPVHAVKYMWMNLNWVNIWFHLGNQFCRK